MEEEEGETVEGREHEESEDADFAGARTGQTGAPPFSDEDEMEMFEFVQANTPRSVSTMGTRPRTDCGRR